MTKFKIGDIVRFKSDHLHYADQHKMNREFEIKKINGNIVCGGEYDQTYNKWSINACEYRLELVNKKKNIELTFKIGDRVKVKDNITDQAYAKNFGIPSEFVIEDILGDLAYTQTGVDIGTWRLELAETPKVIEEVVTSPEYKTTWGIFSKLTGELMKIETTRKQARFVKSDVQTVKKIEYRSL